LRERNPVDSGGLPLGPDVTGELRGLRSELLVRSDHAGLADVVEGAAEFEDDRALHGLVDRGQGRVGDVVALGVDLEHLDLGHGGGASEVDRCIGELVGPGDPLDLHDESIARGG